MLLGLNLKRAYSASLVYAGGERSLPVDKEQVQIAEAQSLQGFFTSCTNSFG